MQRAHSATSAGIHQILVLSLFALSSLAGWGQKPAKPTPAKIEDGVFLVGESVVTNQWSHTLGLVNPPQNVTLLNPGQCIRAAVIATGDDRDALLAKTQLAFHAQYRGHTEDFSLAAPESTKQIKPEGGDMVTAALAAGGIKNPMLSMASMGVSAGKWCAPADAIDGTATVSAEVTTPKGTQKLKKATVQIESFETGSKKTLKDEAEISYFTVTYYRQPEPARLLPALQFVVADETKNPHIGSPIMAAFTSFLSAALKEAPAGTVRDFQQRVANEQRFGRAVGLVALRSAGYDIQPVLKTWSEEERKKFESFSKGPDPFDMSPTRELPSHLDMMWAVFGATGDLEPVKKIASALNWRSDYDALQTLLKTSGITTITPSIMRGASYSAAGWSLGSFQRTDPLAADYIEFLIAAADTPELEKKELSGLDSNPAFKEQKK
ncbi:MAG: hypothetical protein P4L10_15245 [Acidobacteriaceae bacterium]|nr:hypothetical protein [Acidobacteriaceae bacterium]